MKIENVTKYKTSDLRRIFLAVQKHTGITKTQHVRVEPTRRHGVHGRAQVAGNWILMCLPGKNVHAVTVARVFWHEMQHNAGLRHDDMASCWNFDCSFADGMPIGTRAKRQRVKPPKIEWARKKLAQHKAALKRETTLVRKWERRLKRYEKQNVIKGSNA